MIKTFRPPTKQELITLLPQHKSTIKQMDKHQIAELQEVLMADIKRYMLTMSEKYLENISENFRILEMRRLYNEEGYTVPQLSKKYKMQRCGIRYYLDID